MNLKKCDPQYRLGYARLAGWTTTTRREGLQYIMDVGRSGTSMCRLSIVSSVMDERAVRTALARKARRWIYDYLRRASRPVTAVPRPCHEAVARLKAPDMGTAADRASPVEAG